MKQTTVELCAKEKITRSVIELSELPEHLQSNEVFNDVEWVFQFDNDEPVSFAQSIDNTKKLEISISNTTSSIISFKDRKGKEFKIFAREKIKTNNPIARISAKNIMEQLKKTTGQKKETSDLSNLTFYQREFAQKLSEVKWELRRIATDLGGEFDNQENEQIMDTPDEVDHITSLKSSLDAMDYELRKIWLILERLDSLASK